MKHDIRGELAGEIPPHLVGLVPRSFDIIGSKGRSVAIIEIPSELEEYAKAIAEALMRVHGNVKSVLSKGSERLGDYRVRDMRVILGDPATEVLHRESGCVFLIDPVRAYFSPRESTEREKISGKVLSGEEVLVMFSGIGPFPICIAKKQKGALCTAVELNLNAHKFCVQNIKLNKVENRVLPILGDVREVCPKLNKKFDRVLMPLPKGAHEFLDVAINMVSNGGMLHFYHWAPKEDVFTEAERLVKDAAELLGRKAEISERIKVSQYSPSAWKIRIDAKVS